jgi:hypothetical protein
MNEKKLKIYVYYVYDREKPLYIYAYNKKQANEIINKLYEPDKYRCIDFRYVDKSEYLRQEVERIKSTFGYNSDRELVDAQRELIDKLKREII